MNNNTANQQVEMSEPAQQGNNTEMPTATHHLPTLNECAKQALLKHKLVEENETASRDAGKKAIQSAIEAGACLKNAKKMLKHGEWLPWLSANVSGISEETAQRYIRLERESYGKDLSGCETLRQAYLACGILKAQAPTNGRHTPGGSDSGDDSTPGTDNPTGAPTGLYSPRVLKVRNSVRRLMPQIHGIDLLGPEAESVAKAIDPIIAWHKEFLEAQAKRKAPGEQPGWDEEPKDPEWMAQVAEKFPLQDAA